MQIMFPMDPLLPQNFLIECLMVFMEIGEKVSKKSITQRV
jgi:hypothetical protein